jgi:beta-glucanase (GH16 family)
MESIGDASQIYSTAHSTLQPAVEIAARVTPGEFHTFAVSWDDRRLIFYVDNRETGEQQTPADFTKPMFVLANLAIGGNWPGSPDASTAFPANLAIDYIRAYVFAR